MRLIFILPLLITISASGQTIFSGALFPEMAMSYSKNEWMVAMKFQSENRLFDRHLSERWKLNTEQTDFQSFLGYKLSPRVSISLGHQFRFASDKNNSHRSIEQISFVQDGLRIRVGHRIRFDQTYLTNTTLFRYRYRLSLEIPLNGYSLDPTEFYVLFQDEQILSFEANKRDLENRIHGAIGYVFVNSFKLQTGIDYRTDRHFTEGFRHRLWWKSGLFIKL